MTHPIKHKHRSPERMQQLEKEAQLFGDLEYQRFVGFTCGLEAAKHFTAKELEDWKPQIIAVVKQEQYMWEDEFLKIKERMRIL
jgi:hypothetical protein